MRKETICLEYERFISAGRDTKIAELEESLRLLTAERNKAAQKPMPARPQFIQITGSENSTQTYSPGGIAMLYDDYIDSIKRQLAQLTSNVQN